MWARIKRLFRSFIGMFVELAEDPELILKQNIRDMQDQVPQLNENLAMLKAQVTLAEKDHAKLVERESDLTAKIKAALKGEKRDIARTLVVSLEEVKRDKADQERRVNLARQAYEKAEVTRKQFLRQMEKKIEEANKALSAKRQAEWQAKVAGAMEGFGAAGVDATHDEMIEQIEKEAALAEAKLDIAMQNAGGAEQDLEEQARDLQAEETLRQIEMEMGLGEVNAPPAAEEASQEKTLGEARETA